MAMPKPRLRAQKIQELSSHDRIRRAFARRRMIRRNHLVMATLLMAALFLNLWLTSLPICARLDSSVAGLRLQRKGQGHKITSAMPLLEGDVLETQQETILADADGKTKIELGPHSTLRFMKPRVGSFGAHYHLEQGSLSATIAPQPRESAMIFTTQHGRVVVLGTIIQLSTSAYKSSIYVERGCIRWDNLMSGDSSVIKAGESQEISSVRVNFAPSAALPQIQWDVRSDQGFQGKGECFAPALTQQQTISAQGEVELDHDLKFRIKSQNSRIVKYRISRGSEVLEGDFSENIELLIKAGQWKVELSTVCQAGEVFQPEMTWLEFSAL